MKLEVGMYVRTKQGDLFILDRIDDNLLIPKYVELPYVITEEDVSKASHNIIDLIEERDYVNGEIVTNVENGYLAFGDFNYYITDNNDIKSIVTHEQFESMKYEVDSEHN